MAVTAKKMTPAQTAVVRLEVRMLFDRMEMQRALDAFRTEMERLECEVASLKVGSSRYRWALDYKPFRVVYRFWKHAVSDEGSVFGAALQLLGFSVISAAIGGVAFYIALLVLSLA